jgi:glutaredoxin
MVLVWLLASAPALTLPLALVLAPPPPARLSPAPPKPVITIFSLDTCKPCQAAKRIFNKLGMPYNDISITQFPERRDDAFALVPPGVTSMPQIFFGEHHVGGATDLHALLHEEEKFRALYEGAQPSTDARKRPAVGGASALSAATAAPHTIMPVAPPPPLPPPRAPAAPAPSYAEYLASKKACAVGAVPAAASPVAEMRGVTVPTAPAAYHGGKGFGGGEATRDPLPTRIDPDDPKGRQQAIHKAESFAVYLAKRQAMQ